MPFLCVVCFFCLIMSLSNFLCNRPYIPIPKSRNHSHTKFSRRLLRDFFKSPASHELCPYQKSLEQLRGCAQDGLPSSPSWGVTHCSARILRQQLYFSAPNDHTAALNLLALCTYFSEVQTAKNWAFHHFQFL